MTASALSIQHTDNQNSRMWRPILIQKSVVAIIMLVSISAQFNTASFLAVLHWPEGDTPTMSSRFSTWDSAHYLMLSQHGYQPGSSSDAFYPLWPVIIRLGSFVTFGNPLLSSLFLANGLSIAAFWLFYRLVQREYGDVISEDSLILMLAFPGSLFFCFPYTESLYLILVLTFFWGLSSQRYFWTVSAALLMPLVKAIGVFMVFPLAWHCFEHRKPWKYWLMLSIPLIGYAMYFGTMLA